MKKSGAALLALVVAGAVPLFAQESESREAGRSTEAAGAVEGCEGGPLAVVAQFLGLAPPQIQGVAAALQERQAIVGPILHEIAQREQRIRELIAAGGNPAEVGVLVVEIHHLRKAAAGAQAQFLAHFRTILDDTQRSRWAQVRVAAQLQPIVPAFQALQAL